MVYKFTFVFQLCMLIARVSCVLNNQQMLEERLRVLEFEENRLTAQILSYSSNRGSFEGIMGYNKNRDDLELQAKKEKAESELTKIVNAIREVSRKLQELKWAVDNK